MSTPRKHKQIEIEYNLELTVEVDLSEDGDGHIHRATDESGGEHYLPHCICDDIVKQAKEQAAADGNFWKYP